MSTESLCEQLLNSGDDASRGLLLEEAARTADCFAFLLAAAKQNLGAAFRESQRAAQFAIALAEVRADLGGASAAWRVRAQAHRSAGEHSDAEQALQTAASLAARAGDPLLAAQSQIGRIDSLGWLGRYDEAAALARRLHGELLALNAPQDAAKALVNLGSLHYRRDRYEQALQCYRGALEDLVAAGSTEAVARIQANIANVLVELNRVAEALPLFESARAAFAGAGQVTATAMVDANIGFLHYVSGRYGSAIAALDRARQEFAGRGQALEAAKCEADMAEAYRELNVHPEALTAYDNAIGHFSSASVDYERARAEMGRSSVLMALSRFGEALGGLDRAESLFRAHKNRVRTAHVRLFRAYLLHATGRTAEAEVEARAAAGVFCRRRLSGWAAEARFLSADAALRAGTNATRRMQSVSRAARAHRRRWLEARAEGSLGAFWAAQGRTSRALKHSRAGANALEQARTLIAPEEMHVAFLRDKLAIYESVVAALLARGRAADIAEALEYVERAKSRLLLERVQAALDGRMEARAPSPELEARLDAIRAELSRGYHGLNALDDGESRRLGGAGAVEAEALAALEHDYRVLLREADLSAMDSAREISPLPEVVAAIALQQLLRADEALVEFFVVRQSVCAFVVTPNGIRVFEAIATVEEVEFAARQLRFQLQRMASAGSFAVRHAARYQREAIAVLARMYDLLLRPIGHALPNEKIVLVPYSVLHGLPFHALYDGERYALERWEFAYAPSAAVWSEGARRNNAPGSKFTYSANDGLGSAAALIVGVPEAGIEKVAEEIDRIAPLFPRSIVLTGKDATIGAFCEHACRCSVIHLAMHALFRRDNPLFSGLKFADGWLLARDLYRMDLRCDLAVLSACQTGVTFVDAGDELFGLQRGFLAAGARSVVASLWLADDAATASLMEEFYRQMAQGKSRAASLRAAQRGAMRQWPHPYHWAAFVVIGDR